MKIPGNITNYAINLLSGLSNNSDSIVPMAVKDTVSNCATVATYKSKGGKHDARERAMEDFATGALWLFGIPTTKKLIDKTIYPLLKLKPEFDIKLLKNNENLQNAIKSANTALLNDNNNSILKEITEVLNSLDKNNPVLSNFKNKDLYKGLFIAKFAISTLLTAFGLAKIIQFKQKSTQKRLEKEIKEKQIDNYTRSAMDKKVKASNVYSIFKGNEEKNKNVSFKGGLDFFMYNPIANTSILDGIITTTRLKEARKGEKREVALKEAFQIFFIYAVAKPIQIMFEKFGRKINAPIELDPKVLFSSNVKDEIKQASEFIKNQGIDKLNSKELTSAIQELSVKDIKNPLLQVLNKNGTISIIEKNGTQALDYMKDIESKKIKGAVENILTLDKDVAKNLSKIKTYKVFAVLGNIAIGVFALGVLQPLINIAMRKFFNNGDNRNPAIVAQEKELQFKAQQA